MALEREYKVGDCICTFSNQKGVVVGLNNPPFSELNLVVVKWDDGTETGISESQIWHEGGTPKFDYMAHQAKLDHEGKLLRAEELRKIERAFDEAIKAYPRRIKYPVGVRVRWEQYGCGTVVKASPFVLTVKFANNYERDISAYPPLRFATAEDEQYDPCAVLWAPEPIDETATLVALESHVRRWADVVKFIDGNQDDDEIKHDLFVRECLHGTLNGLKKQGIAVPVDLLEKLNQADQYFIENSIADEMLALDVFKNRVPCMGAVTLLDPVVFWYEYRWPKKKEKA